MHKIKLTQRLIDIKFSIITAKNSDGTLKIYKSDFSSTLQKNKKKTEKIYRTIYNCSPKNRTNICLSDTLDLKEP